MKTNAPRWFILLPLLVFVSSCLSAETLSEAHSKLKVLVVTGGHGFEKEPFFRVFNDNPEITVTFADQGKTNAPVYEREDLLSYDTVVLYDMPKTITDAQKSKFRSLLAHGTGLVVLHHALVSYQKWPEYEKIIGGKYLTDSEESEGKLMPSSTYHEGLEVPIVIIASDHPIVRDIKDFTIHDEIYVGVRVQADVIPLFITTHPLNNRRPMGWYRLQDKSRIVYLQLGHGREAYENANYRRLVANSIRWVARQSARTAAQ